MGSPDDGADDAECGAPEEFVDLERRLVTDPAVKAWAWDPDTPDVIDVQMRRLSAAQARERVTQALAPTRVRFVRRIKF